MSDQNSLLPLEPHDTFSVWADKINAIQDFLVTTDFSTDEETVNLTLPQIISGNKTFTATTIFNGFNNQTGNFTLGGNIGTINCSTLNVECSNGVTFIGAKGLELKSNSNESSISLKFSAGNDPARLQFDYAGIDEGIFEISTGNRLDLKDGKLGVGNIVWNLPTTNPNTPSLLQWTNLGNNVSWKPYSELTEDIIDDVQTTLANTGLTLTVNLIPVGVQVDIDPDALTSWGAPTVLVNDLFPGWLRCNGQTIDRTVNADFTELVRLLNDGNSTPTTGTLPNTSGKLIKYKQDPVTSFALKTGNGIEFLNSTTNAALSGDLTLKSIGGRIGLKVNSNHFEFTTGSNQLSLKNLSDGPGNNTIAQRTSTGQLRANSPIIDSDLSTKFYVDNEIEFSRNSTLAFPEIIDGICYSDTENSFVLVDKYNNGKAYGDTNLVRGVDGGDKATADLLLNTFSPLAGNLITKYKKAFSSPSQYFFVDNDDILYANGSNSIGVLGNSGRGIASSVAWEASYFSSWNDTTNPYSTTTKSGMTVPAMLPFSGHWPAFAVKFDYATGINSTSLTTNTNLTIKTKDGYGNRFISDDPKQGFLYYASYAGQYINQPYTRGYFISIGSNIHGEYGKGDAAINTFGPRVWAPDAISNANIWETTGRCGRVLWDIYGRRESERANDSIYLSESTARENIRKRFNWFKPNAVKAGGLGATDALALAAWRTETGLNNNESFSDYSWYIKKVVRTRFNHFVIVGKPGDETLNECWVAGSNVSGNLSNGTRFENSSYDFVRVCGSSFLFQPNTFRKIVVGVGQSNTEYERVDGADHGFRDLEVLQVGLNSYYIVRGNTQRSNIAKQFRLFANAHDAANALVRRSNVGVYSTTGNPLSGSNVTRVSALLGVIDIVASSKSSTNETFYARVATSNNVNTNALDALPESAITNISLWAWGSNASGCLGISRTFTAFPRISIATPCIFNGLANNAKISRVVASNIHNVVFAYDSFNKDLWFVGSNTHGLGDSGTITALADTNANNEFRKTILSNGEQIYNFFFIDARHSSLGEYSRIFLITKNTNILGDYYYLYGGGRNLTAVLGTNAYYDKVTPNYVRIPFVENPNNIVSMCGVGTQTFALVKDSGRDIGRVYQTGYDNYVGKFSSADGNRTYPFFRNIDRFIV